MIVGELATATWDPCEPIGRQIQELSEKIIEARRDAANQNVMISRLLDQIPAKTLNTIQGSINTTTGKIGELIKFIELQRTYDRLIPVGDIVDFIGISFPVGDSPGVMDFIEVKTGDKAVLSPDQKKFKLMFGEKKAPISFKVVRVDIT